MNPLKIVYNTLSFAYHIPPMSELEATIVRPMTESDLDKVLSIEQVSYPTSWRREHFIHEIHSHTSFPYVAVLDGMIAGYVCLMSLFERKKIWGCVCILHA